MAIHFVCLHCRKRMKSPERFAGKPVTCPACKMELIVPKKKAVRTQKEKAKWEPSEERGAKKGPKVDKEARPESEIETRDLESEARAVLREMHEAES